MFLTYTQTHASNYMNYISENNKYGEKCEVTSTAHITKQINQLQAHSGNMMS
jgi:hypothetical protein